MFYPEIELPDFPQGGLCWSVTNPGYQWISQVCVRFNPTIILLVVA